MNRVILMIKNGAQSQRMTLYEVAYGIYERFSLINCYTQYILENQTKFLYQKLARTFKDGILLQYKAF